MVPNTSIEVDSVTANAGTENAPMVDDVWNGPADGDDDARDVGMSSLGGKLISRLILNADLTKAYSPEGVARACKRFGLADCLFDWLTCNVASVPLCKTSSGVS